MKRSMVAVALVLAVAAPSVASARGVSWGSVKSWIKRSVATVVSKISDPQAKQAIDELRTYVNSLKGQLKGLRPQFRALTGYLAVAAAKAKQGKDLSALLPLVAKIKESAAQIGQGGVRAVRSWLKQNRKALYRLGGSFRTLYSKGARVFKNRVLGWWRKMKKKLGS